jgi:hypothetical protein
MRLNPGQRQAERHELLRVRRNQLQQHLRIAGLREVVVEAAQLRHQSVPRLGVPTERNQHGSLPASVSANGADSIPAASARHRYIHDYDVGLEVVNVRNDRPGAVDALGVVPLGLKQGHQGLDCVLIVVHNENAGAVRHGEPSYRCAAGTVVKNGARAALRVAQEAA